MSQITEPLSKRDLFSAMRAKLIVMAAAEFNAQKPDADVQELSQRHDEAAAKLLALHRKAEDGGLMRELAGYLSTTYGG